MIILNLIFAIFSTQNFYVNSININNVRANYEVAVSDKKICKLMLSELCKNESPVLIAYYGAYQTIWANHVYNPIEKLKTFNKGKRNIDKAIKLSPNNVEIIFIRYSIQKNSPAFLSYKSNLKEDQKILKQNFSNINSIDLKRMIENVLKD